MGESTRRCPGRPGRPGHLVLQCRAGFSGVRSPAELAGAAATGDAATGDAARAHDDPLGRGQQSFLVQHDLGARGLEAGVTADPSTSGTRRLVGSVGAVLGVPGPAVVAGARVA